MRRTATVLLVPVWLWFTGATEARADPSRSPMVGPEARLGTAVGFSHLGDATVYNMGGELAIGYQLNHLTVEAELDSLAMLHYVESRYRNRQLGRLDRWSVSARLDVIRLGRRVDPSSVFRIYVEAGAGRERGRWNGGLGFSRNDVSGGGGWILDHRVRPRPGGGGLGLRWLGWQFGWRATRASGGGASDAALLVTCRTSGGAGGCPPMPGPASDTALVITSSFTAAW